MTVFQQSKGTCVGFAILNAIEQQFRIRRIKTFKFYEKDVYDYFKKQGWDQKKGIRIFNFLQRMKRDPFMGVGVEDYECIYNHRKRNNTFWKTALASAITDKSLSVIIGLRTREIPKIGKPKIELTKSGYIIPYKTKVKDYHAVYITGVNSKGDFKCENSWGKDWGKNGFFYMTIDNMETECEQIYSVKFN